MNLVNYIEHHPSIAFVVGAIHLGLAHSLDSLEIPSIVMQVFQIGAWVVTILVGCISIYGSYKKWRKK